MGQAKLQGSFVVGPTVVTDSSFPNGVSTATLATTPDPKPSQVDSGLKVRNLNSPNAYVALSGVGVTDDVTNGDTFYFRCRSPVLLRLTFYNPLQPGSPVVSVIPVMGTHVCEYPQDRYLTLVEVQGSGQIEYLVSGQQ